jgi:hypothetical protein
MIFEFRLDEVQLWCSSPECTRRLVAKGARLVNPAQAEDLRRVLEAAASVPAVPSPGPAAGPTVE